MTRVAIEGTPNPYRRLLTCTRAGARRHPAVAATLDELHRAAPLAVA